MKINKNVCTTLAVCTALVANEGSVFAGIAEISCETNYGIVEFSGSTDISEEVTFLAYKKDSDNVLCIGEPIVDGMGNFSFQTGFKTSGDYVIKIKNSSGDVFVKEINDYVNLEEKQKFLLGEINTGDDEKIKTALDEMNLSFNNISWSEITDKELSEWIVKYIGINGTYEDITAVEEEYVIQNALYAINTAKVSSIQDEVEKNADFLDIADNKYVKSFISKGTTAHKSMLVSELGNNPATTSDMIEEAVEKVMTTKNPNSYSGGSSSGGGGGGSLSSVIANKNIENITPVQKPEIVPENPIEFTDLSEAHWAKEAVTALVSKKIISGFDDNTFKPDKNVTREEFVKMIVVAFGISYEGKKCEFLDVFENDWFAPYVEAARECEIVTGISEDLFGIHKEITREDAAVILKRASDYAKINLAPVREYEEFADGDNISQYAKESVAALYKSGAVNGKGDKQFAPKQTCTRAEAANMIYKIIEGGGL